MIGSRIRTCLALLALTCAACSGPRGATDVPYGVRPATIFGAPDSDNVFFQRAALTIPGSAYALATDPANGHVGTGCTGTTDFSGNKMIIDWSCTGATRTVTLAGTLVWDGKEYFGDCTTSFTSATINFTDLVVPFRAF